MSNYRNCSNCVFYNSQKCIVSSTECADTINNFNNLKKASSLNKAVHTHCIYHLFNSSGSTCRRCNCAVTSRNSFDLLCEDCLDEFSFLSYPVEWLQDLQTERMTMEQLTAFAILYKTSTDIMISENITTRPDNNRYRDWLLVNLWSTTPEDVRSTVHGDRNVFIQYLQHSHPYKSVEDMDNELPGMTAKRHNSTSSTRQEDITSMLDENVLKYGRVLTSPKITKTFTGAFNREPEIQQLINVLARRYKHNPLLLGEAGVGKTAIVEQLACLINSPNCPELLQNMHIFELSLGSLVGGTKYRGDFEERLNHIIHCIQHHNNIILFIDEIHLICGMGNADNASADLANLLKPALGRGDITVIGATTYSEYTNSIEKDKALNRRFGVINVDELSKEATLDVVTRSLPVYEKHHHLTIPTTLLPTILDLCQRYVPNSYFPDKALTLLDTTCACARTQGIKKLTEDHVYTTLSQITHIPKSQLITSNYTALKNLQETLSSVVKGQSEAVEVLTKTLIKHSLGIGGEKRGPIGSFLFAGPTGVGKTELSKTLATHIFGSENNLIRVDMSEMMESHSVSKIIGAPAGYIGYDNTSTVCDKIKNNPYSVLLLDEVEKAHPQVLNTFLQVFDNGFLTTSHGTKVDFRNTVVIMTSNLGSNVSDVLSSQKPLGFGVPASSSTKLPDKGILKKNIDKAVKKHFSPEFINRLDAIVVFNTLDESSLLEITTKQLTILADSIIKLGFKLKYSNVVAEYIVKHGYDVRYGVRSIQHYITNEIENIISNYLLEMLSNSATGSITIGVRNNTLHISSKCNSLANA